MFPKKSDFWKDSTSMCDLYIATVKAASLTSRYNLIFGKMDHGLRVIDLQWRRRRTVTAGVTRIPLQIGCH